MFNAITAVTAGRKNSLPQFDIRGHYNQMAVLDADVHDDTALAQAEAQAALALIGNAPQSVFLPCCGTGRHIAPLLAQGVERIVGVDLSDACLAKARVQAGENSRVALHCADLRKWSAPESLDALIMLGNSFGDLINPRDTAQMVAQMLAQLRRGAVVVMDYIGANFLKRCARKRAARWQITYNGQPCTDTRTPSYDLETGVMTIAVAVTNNANGAELWRGYYQKLVLSDNAIQALFASCGVWMEQVGVASQIPVLRDYYAKHQGELGMIGASTWWRGIKL